MTGIPRRYAITKGTKHAPPAQAARLAAWLSASLLALLGAIWLAPLPAQAGTVTIVDGPNTPPVGGVFIDGYIQAQLAASSLTITTTGIITGPDEIRVLPGAVITWTAGTTLTLDAGSSIVISGTLQHDGPANGAGGLYLLASEAPTGTVMVGAGDQITGVAAGSRFGLTRVQAGNLALHGGGSGTDPYALLGFHAVDQGATYSVTGAISVTAGQNLNATGGAANYAYVQIGHGGADSAGTVTASGAFSGAIAVNAGGNVTFQGGSGERAYAQLGNGGWAAGGDHSGGHSLNAGGDVTFQGGAFLDAYAQMGNGGPGALGNQSGDHSLTTTGGRISFQGGAGTEAYGQYGNGGPGADGEHSGSLALTNTGDLGVSAGFGADAYAMLGHGSDVRVAPVYQSMGNRAGDISLRVGETAVFSGSQVGHLTANGVLSVTQGNTTLGVSQNNPSYLTGAGQLLVTGAITSNFASAPTGELRVYLPRADSQQIPTNATFNGETFVVTRTIPPERIQGFFLFGEGPYAPLYSFYLGGRPDVAVTKTATPTGALRPGQLLTYTVSFSNTGSITASGALIKDALPGAVTFGSATPQADAGVTITPTTGAPNLAWSVSSLGPGKGGKVVVVANLQNSALMLGATFTNTATITATGDSNADNNLAYVARDVVAAATLIVTKTVVGAPPANVWQFGGSGGIGAFSLPAIGGTRFITGLIPIPYTISETTQSGYGAAVSCTGGASGTSSVQVALSPGVTTGCTFTNSLQSGTVEGIVYEDANGNNQPDVDEGLAGVTVTLQSEADVAAALTLSDVTDGDGAYGFADVPTGDYTLSFAMPAGYAPLENAQVTVAAGQAVEAPERVAVKAGPGKVYVPVIQR